MWKELSCHQNLILHLSIAVLKSANGWSYTVVMMAWKQQPLTPHLPLPWYITQLAAIIYIITNTIKKDMNQSLKGHILLTCMCLHLSGYCTSMTD
jgi:hypothetical protein